METARIEALRSPRSSKNSARVWPAAGGAPHDPAACVVGHVGQVPPAAAVGDLIDPDLNQAVQTPVIQPVGDHPFDDPPDRVPGHAQQRLDLALGHPLGAERNQILELPSVPGAATSPRDRLDPHPAITAVHPPELVLQKTAMTSQIQMPPAAHVPIVHARIDLAAHRADDPVAAKPDPNHHPLPGQPDPGDAHTSERQQPVQCRGDAHAVPPLKSSCSRQPAAFTKGRRRVSALRATSEKNLTAPECPPQQDKRPLTVSARSHSNPRRPPRRCTPTPPKPF
jgi:hypothetical protein